MQEAMRDAAFASNITGWDGVVAGYIGGPSAYHPWAPTDWEPFRGKGKRKLAVWVCGQAGEDEGFQALREAYSLGIPKGAPIVADMETRVDRQYLENFSSVLSWGGYKTWVYGSGSTVFGNPALNGYWVADYTGSPYMYDHPSVRATQYANGEKYDSSTIKEWALELLTWWE